MQRNGHHKIPIYTLIVLSEYFVSTCINECPGENVKSVPLSEAIDLLTDHFIPFDNE